MADEVEFGSRPWHGSDNPFEALWLHFTAEIEKLRGGSAAMENAGTVEALPMPGTPYSTSPTVIVNDGTTEPSSGDYATRTETVDHTSDA